MCQLLNLNDMGIKNSAIVEIWQYRIRVLKKLKRHFVYIKNKLIKLKSLTKKGVESDMTVDRASLHLKAGERVRVRSKEEIRRTLDEHDKYKGCLFVSDMWQYCGREYRVLKVVEHFYDEAKFKVQRCHETVILEGVVCEGVSNAFKQRCDRTCFFFWKEAWLEKIE